MIGAPATTVVRDAAPIVVDAPVQEGHARGDHRLESLDFVKGALVLLMVVYHWLNYFIGLQWEGYRYLRFLTPAFIFISGFLVSRVYLARYSADDPALRRRLLGRGLKLLALFLGLNILIDWTVGAARIFNASDSSVAIAWAKAIFISGRPVGAFEILVSIAYFLLLAPFVLLVSKRLSIPLWTIASVAILTAAIVSATNPLTPHLEILPLGLMGLAIGAHSSSRLAAALSSTLLLVPLYVIYLAAVTAWNVSYPLLVIGVALNLLLISVVTNIWGTKGTIQRYIVRMGQYSLLAYIAQIAALQLLRRVLQGQLLTAAGFFASFVAALVLTFVAVELAALLRSRSAAFDRLYRWVLA